MKILRILTGVSLICCILFTATIGKNIIGKTEAITQSQEYKGIITMWQIDGFEGGTGSRKQFLLKVARGFEKENNGVLIMVVDQTYQSATESIKNGKLPDLISYSNGLESSNILTEITPSKTIPSCQMGGKTYATAWCRGGYVLISNPELTQEVIPNNEIDCLLVSQGEYTEHLTAIVMEGIKVKSVKVKKPMDAYVEFVAGKMPYFLGTQRDLVRLNNRGMNVNAYPLVGFNDLYQYVSVTSTEQLKGVYAEKFIEYLISEKVQSKLTEIKMFSEYYKLNFDDEKYSALQSVKGFKSISALSAPEQLKELQRISALALSGETDYINKIKNMLV